MPFHNIFKKRKQKQVIAKSTKTPLIIADIHEKNSLILAELHKSTQVRLEIKSLKIGDYLIGNTIIERKTSSDFISSMINKRLIQQLKQMKKYKQQLLIIEGELDLINNETNLNSNAVRGFILSIINNFQTPIIFTQNYQDTSQYLITLAKQQLKKPIESSLHYKIPKNKQEQKQYVLESFPNIGPIKAKKLLKKFKSIKNTINADEEDLKDILKNRSKDFKDLLEN